MHYTEGSNNVAGQFTDGDPQQQILATTVEENWLNTVQNEIANTVLCAGLTLKTANTETNVQLSHAVKATIGTLNVGPMDFSPYIVNGAFTAGCPDISITEIKPKTTGVSSSAYCDITKFLRPGMKLTSVDFYGHTGGADGTVEVEVFKITAGAHSSLDSDSFTGGDSSAILTLNETIATDAGYVLGVTVSAASSVTNAFFWYAKLVVAEA